MDTQFVLGHAKPEDVERIVEIETVIFTIWSGYAALGLQDSIPRRLIAQARYHHAIANDPTAHVLKITDTTTSQIIGIGYWNIYTRKQTPEDLDRDYQFDYSPDVPSFASLLRYSKDLNDNRTRLLGDRDGYCLLRWLAVDPAYRRKGIATTLLSFGMEQGDKLGLPCMLEATREGEVVYKQHGFESQGEFWTHMKDEEGKPIHGGNLMVREPKHGEQNA